MQGWFYARLAVKYALGAALLIAGFWFHDAWIALVVGALLFAFRQAQRGAGSVGPIGRFILVPFLKLAYDAAYLIGYAQGRLSKLSSPGRPLRDRESPRASD